MSRQWRIEYEGALYHVMSRGNQGREIVSMGHNHIFTLTYIVANIIENKILIKKREIHS